MIEGLTLPSIPLVADLLELALRDVTHLVPALADAHPHIARIREGAHLREKTSLVQPLRREEQGGGERGAEVGLHGGRELAVQHAHRAERVLRALGLHELREETKRCKRELCALAERLVEVEPTGAVERLRSSFLGGVKHVPIRWTLKQAPTGARSEP